MAGAVTVTIHVAAHPGEAHVAAIRQQDLIDYAVWRPGSPDGVGDLHRGRVAALVPHMAGAFVTLAGAQGFLPDSEGAKGLTAGTILPVRITRSAQSGKGPRLTARIDGEPVPSGPVGLVARGPNPAEDMAARYAGAELLCDDPAVAATLRASIGARVRVTHDPLPDPIADAIDALSRPTVTLPSGPRLSIWPTPALVAIDVDAGGATTRLSAAEVNRLILPPLAQQIRLRNLSGAIVVDIAGLPARKRAALTPDFTAALAKDPLRPKFLGFTALGLAEIVRTRVHPPLHEVLSGPLAAGLAGLRAVLAATGRQPPALRAHPAIIEALQADAAGLADMRRRTGRDVRLRADPGLPEAVWLLEDHDA